MEKPKRILWKQKLYFYKYDNFKDMPWGERIELIENEKLYLNYCLNYVWRGISVMQILPRKADISKRISHRFVIHLFTTTLLKRKQGMMQVKKM